MDNKKRSVINIVDRTLFKSGGKNEVSLSAFCFLFGEYVQYIHRRVATVAEMQRKLADIGYCVGLRLIEYISLKERMQRRETKIEKILLFIANNVWKMLFGKEAILERAKDDIKYMISDNECVVNKFISTPPNSGLNCAAFVGGIVEAILDATEFPAKVTTHSVDVGGQRFPKTVILIEFSKDVLTRDAKNN
jgi:hypothetical protein